VFYYEPSYKGRGRPAKYGKRFKLSDAKQEADDQTLTDFKGQRLRITSYSGLHAAKFMKLPLIVLKLEFIDKEDKAIFQKPIWLISTATKLHPETIARAYLWRSSHELSFRFMKQHLGLTKNQSPELKACDNWFQLVALAMNLLLAIRDELVFQAKPWYPQKDHKAVSQRQAQKQALSFFTKLPILTKPAQPAGKAWGRPEGHSPPRRIRHPVIRKTSKKTKPCPSCPFKQAA